MYDSTITVFNRSGSEKKGFVWFPTVIDGVYLIIDKGAGMVKTGLAEANKCRSIAVCSFFIMLRVFTLSPPLF